MKKKLLLIWCLVLTATLVSCKKNDGSDSAADSSSAAVGNGSDFSYSYEDPSDSKLGDPDPLDASWSNFDYSLTEYLYSNGHYDSNYVVSPAAFRASLCLAAEGAEGDTLAELTKAMGFSDSDEAGFWCDLFRSDITHSITKLSSRKGASDKDKPVFAAYDSIWSDKDLLGEISYSYKVYAEKQPHAEAYACASDELSASLDKWVSDKTGGAISKTGKDVTGASSVLASTVYLDALWPEGVKMSVHKDVFTDIDGVESSVDFMELTGEFLYADENGTQILVLPLEGGMSFACILGSRTDMFDKLTGLKKEKVHVMIPEFEISSLFDASDLMNYLISRGADEALIGRNADFGNICEDADWFLQELLQTSKISVSAGVSGDVSDNNETYDEDAIKEFKADTPFSFAVFSDTETEQRLLLCGQMMTVGK